MQARDVMTTRLVTVTPETSVQEIAKQLIERRISAIPVVGEDNHVVGIVSEGDLMRRPETGGQRRPSWWLTLFDPPPERAAQYVRAHGLRARDVMTREMVTVSEDASLEEIATLLERHRIKRVPVVRDGKLVGIVSRANLLHGLVARKHGVVSSDDRSVKAALHRAVAQTGVNTSYLNIVLAQGVVYLWGVVESEQEHAALRVAAETTPGVRKIEDHVGVLDRAPLRGALWS